MRSKSFDLSDDSEQAPYIRALPNRFEPNQIEKDGNAASLAETKPIPNKSNLFERKQIEANRIETNNILHLFYISLGEI